MASRSTKFFRNSSVILVSFFLCIQLNANEYWQQDVQYSLDVTLDTKEHVINGQEHLTYINHSPDTLQGVYFHLYQNAYTKGSYLDAEYRKRGSRRIKRLKPSEEAGTFIHSFTDNSGNALRYTVDNTVIRVDLPKPLLPGDSIKFQIDFTTRFGGINRRMKRQGNTYTAAHWYPRIAVYDARRGWNKDQHLGSEFYGDFGDFDLTISAPAHFIIGGTGKLLNRNEVLPDSLRERLDVRNFKDKPWGAPASTVIEPTSDMKTWRYHAENVHDVAWIASPDFRIGEAEWNGIKVYSFAKEAHASGWQDAAAFTAKLLAYFSETFGKYDYPKIIVSDVNSGMEYPMLTADGGKSPTYYGLLAHEVAHNWFYGMVGSNETYRAMMDEGFTNFAASNAMDEIVGGTTYWDSTGNWYQRKFYPDYTRKYYRNDLQYLQMAHTGYLVSPLATHSDKFNEYGEYRQVYFKTAEMLYNLKYVLGDSVFSEVMQRYVEKWKFEHPYPDDFVAVVEEVTGDDFTWYFDEWIHGTSTIDYSIRQMRNERLDTGDYQVKIRLKRKDFMPMPIDLVVDLENGETRKYIIPVTDGYVKQEDASTTMKPWFGWGEINDTYTLIDTLPAPAGEAQIDPSGLLADVYRLDNVNGFGVPIDWHFDNMFHTRPSLDEYDVWLRPSFLYNSVDGFKPGIHWRSRYLESSVLAFHALEGGLWYGPLSGSIGYQFDYQTPVKSLGRLTKFHASSQVLEGRKWYSLGLSGQVRDKLYGPPYTKFDIQLHQNVITGRTYLPDRSRWDIGLQRFFSMAINHGYSNLAGDYNIIVQGEADVLPSDFNYSLVDAQFRYSGSFFGWLGTKIRLYGAIGEGNIPAQRGVYIAGGSPADAAAANWLYRSRGSLPITWLDNDNIGFGGGLNLRGYPDLDFPVKRGLSASIETRIPSLTNWALKKIFTTQWYLFADGGYFIYDPEITDWLSAADAGLGFTIPLKKIPSSIGKYTIRLDFPVWKSMPVRGEDNFEFRWVFAFGRSW